MFVALTRPEAFRPVALTRPEAFRSAEDDELFSASQFLFFFLEILSFYNKINLHNVYKNI
jgi:hypothetical protein